MSAAPISSASGIVEVFDETTEPGLRISASRA